MRILFITLTNIGDVVLSTPLLHRILADHPDAVVDVVVGAKSADLLAGLPQLGTLYPVVKKRRHGHYIDLYKQCSQTKYDLIVDLRTPLLGRCLKGRKKIIYKPARGHKAQQFASLWPSDAPLKPKVWVHKTPELIEYYEKIRAEARPFSKPPCCGDGGKARALYGGRLPGQFTGRQTY
jgi:ADP-heptose:LPS heptosyltransferase